MSVIAIIAAGGRGVRYGDDVPKQFLPVSGKMVIEYSLATFAASPSVHYIVVVVPPGLSESILDPIFSYRKVVAVVPGGERRQDSVMSGLAAIKGVPEIVLVHDAARPNIRVETVEELVAEARETGAAVPALSINDTVKYSRNGRWIEKTVKRENYFRSLTPQAFRGDLLLEAAREARDSNLEFTDEAQMVESYGGKISIVRGDRSNLKVTFPEDLEYFKTLMGSYSGNFRVGLGYDAHKMVKGRSLYLGGIKIDSEYGLLGHSDGDCALHAISDALLGGAGLGDIGYHFPPTDGSIKGIRSGEIVKDVAKKVKEKDFRIVNVDCVIICQRPTISDYSDRMVGEISDLLEIPRSSISIKGKTTEGMGFEGTGEGISAISVALLEQVQKED